MALSGGQVSLGVSPDAKGFGAKLSNAVMGESGSFSGMGKKLGGLIVGGLAIAGVGASIGSVFKTGFDEAKDASAGMAQLTAGIKSTGNAANVSVSGMEDLASSIQGMSGQTDDSIVGAEQLLLTFTNIKNVGPDKIFNQATMAAADMAAKMGGDASSQAVLLGKALNDPAKGLLALTRVGVSFTQGQKDSIAAMVKSGDTMGAQKVILGELNKEFGGAAKAAGESLPGQLERTKRSFEDISQSIAEGFMPIIMPAIGGVASALSKLSPHVATFAQDMSVKLGKVGDAFKAVSDLLIKGDFTHAFSAAFHVEEDSPVVGVLFGIRDAFKETVGGVRAFAAAFKAGGTDITSSGFAGVLEGLGLKARALFDKIGPTLARAFDVLKSTIGPLLPQLVGLAAALSPVHLIFEAIEPVLPTLVDRLGSLAATVAGNLGKALQDALPTITQLAGVLASGLSVAVVDLLPLIVGLVGVVGSLIEFLSGHMGIVYAFVGAIVAWNVATSAISFVKTIAGLYATSAAWARNTAAMVASKTETLILMGMYTKDFVFAMGRTIAGVAASTGAWIANTAAQIGAKAITLGGAAAMGIATAAQWLWNAAMTANPIGIVVVAIAALVGAILWVALKTTFFQDTWRVMTRAMGAAFSWVWNSVIKPVADWIGGAISGIGRVVGSVFGGIGSAIRGGFNGVVSFVRDIFNNISGIVNGIIDGINNVTSKGAVIGIHVGKIPHLPSLAEGATVLPRPGGTIVRVAEAGKAESVVDTGEMNKLIRKANEGGSGGSTFNIYEAVSAQATALQVARRQAALGV